MCLVLYFGQRFHVEFVTLSEDFYMDIYHVRESVIFLICVMGTYTLE